MEYTLKNRLLTVRVSDHGAEMQSILGADGVEYLWQGDPAYWARHATNLFPHVGRLTNGTYTWNGNTYELGPHGFARNLDYTLVEQTEDTLVLELTDSDETRKGYPFAFSYQLRYRLENDTLFITFRVENRGGEVLPFGLGAHPGFRVPMADGLQFTDYKVVFGAPCNPRSLDLSPAAYLAGTDSPYPLTGNAIPLRHDLFDNDAIILKDMARSVSLVSDKDPHGVIVSFPDMPYLGLWHTPKTEAPFLCIEPWATLPAVQDIVEDFATKEPFFRLAPGGVYENTWSIQALGQ